MASFYEKAKSEDLVFKPPEPTPMMLGGFLVLSTVIENKKYTMFKADGLPVNYVAKRMTDTFNNGSLAFLTKSPSAGTIIVINQRLFELGFDFLKNLFLLVITIENLSNHCEKIQFDVNDTELQNQVDKCVSGEIGEQVYSDFLKKARDVDLKMVINERWFTFD